ncbi:MAG: hypothetical protein ABI041_11390 [Bdellovibrionia bacterium]
MEAREAEKLFKNTRKTYLRQKKIKYLDLAAISVAYTEPKKNTEGLQGSQEKPTQAEPTPPNTTQPKPDKGTPEDDEIL